MLLIKNVLVFDGERFCGKADVLCGEKIEKILPAGADFDAPCEVFDADGLILAPGFIDIHIHGAAGHDVMEADKQAFAAIAKAIAKTGTTSWLATSVTSSQIETCRFLAAANEFAQSMQPGCAEILGVHLEGPFISEKRKGAQNADYILPASIENYEKLIGCQSGCERCGGCGTLIRRVSLAPEIDGALELVKELASRGVKVSAGHTDASAKQFIEAVERGLTLTTHFFNCMPPLHHRAPGVVGATLARDDVYAELIGDFVHLHPDVIKLTLRAKGADKCLLVSDAISAALSADGDYILGGLPVTVKDGRAFLADGTIAGSTAMVADAVYNLVSYGIPAEKALRMASLTPAEAIGVNGYKGRVREGWDADLVLLSSNYKVKSVVVKGKII